MATFTKSKLSGSTSGTPIPITLTTGSGDLIHTAVASTGAAFDEIWLYANNTSTSPILLTIQFGGTTDPQHLKPITLAPQSGDVLVVAGLILQNSLVVRAIAATASKVTISGYVNSIS
jgi:hypothetical protein